MTKIGVVSLATGTKYLDYWKKMILTFKANESKFQSIQFYLLTDSVAEVEEFCRVNQINSKIFLIPSYGWPEATLLRYQEILAIKEFMIEEVCIYLDADMLIQTDIVPKLTSSEWKNGMAFIAHPGFWRPRGLARAIFYLKYPNRILRNSEIWGPGRGMHSQQRMFQGKIERSIFVEECGWGEIKIFLN
jgi:hypothetical protein